MSRADQETTAKRDVRAFGFSLVSALTTTLGLAFAVLTALSAGDGVGSNSSDKALQTVRLMVVALGLLGLGTTALLIMLGRRSSRAGLIGLIVIGAAMAGAATLVATLLPNPSPTRPVGAKPLALLGLAVGLLAWASALVTNRWRHADSSVVDARPSWWWRALAVGTAIVVAIGAGAGVVALRTAFRASADSYLEVGERSPAQPAITSQLDGSVAWRAAAALPESGGLYAATGSTFGLPMTIGSEVVMIDRSSGRPRWRFFRSDLDDYTPHPIAVDGGSKVLIDWTSEHAGFLVLDADTGRRLAQWPSADADADLEAVLDDGALLGHTVSKGSDSIARVDLQGRERWRFAPGRCEDLSADAAAGVAVVAIHSACAEPTDRLIGLDLAGGRQLWTATGNLRPLLVTGDTVIAAESDDGDVTALSALDPQTGRVTWTRSLQPGRGISCPDRYIQATGQDLQVVCTGENGENATVLRLSVGSDRVRRLSLGSDRFEDVVLTADGRSVVLARRGESDASPRRILVSTGTGWRSVPPPSSDDPTGFRLGVVGNQVLLGEAGRAVLALN